MEDLLFQYYFNTFVHDRITHMTLRPNFPVAIIALLVSFTYVNSQTISNINRWEGSSHAITAENSAISEGRYDLCEETCWHRDAYVKANLLEGALFIANIAGEMDLWEQWSFALPVSWSSWDYTKSTIKFRTFKIMPEIRFWSYQFYGLFVGAHFGLAYYNLAIDGKYRFQDRDGKHPAIGGGISVGYRMPVFKSSRWKLEFSIGGGAYSLDYDKFLNASDYHRGSFAGSKKKTYYGIDNASVSIVYSFHLTSREEE